jgi:hypothetical protein
LLHDDVEMGEDTLHGDEGKFVKKSLQSSGRPISPKAMYLCRIRATRHLGTSELSELVGGSDG